MMSNDDTIRGDHQPAPPLSWREARNRLRETLQRYLQTSINTVDRSTANNERESVYCYLTIWHKWDLDIICGVAMSVSLLIITILSFTSQIGDNIDGNTEQIDSFTRSQLIGAVAILCGCAVNIWIINRYRYSASHGIDSLKRRMISKFLKELNEQERRCKSSASTNGNQVGNQPSINNHDSPIDLQGTSLTDIYPVYRLSDDHREGSWCRVPTLLLVNGDRIALQVGDSAPAKCRVVEGKMSMKVFETGQEIRLDDSSGESVESLLEKLNKGRTTLPSQDTNGLLRLCNDVRIFEIIETPLEIFLRESQNDSKKPQLFRQLDAARGMLSLVAVTVFFLTTFVLLARYQRFTSNLSYLLPTPFLAAIGVFPVFGPGCLIFIEALGMARILASYHPVASRVRMDSPSDVVTRSVDVDLLILRYFLATLSNRLSLQRFSKKIRKMFNVVCRRSHGKASVGNSSMVWVPPASLNLLEKLGVATAFTLVDDELVCEPQALPQQLLIPSGKGLKLLDLCPTYEDESDDESDADVSSSLEFRRNRQRSFDVEMNDSDSDSDDGMMKDHHHVPSGRKIRRRLLRRTFRVSAQRAKEVEDDDSDTELTNHEVQFEDPGWWQHLPSLKCIGLACLLVDQRNENDGLKLSSSVNNGNENLAQCKMALARLVCRERNSMQLRSLARCIGFSTKPSAFGKRGDASPFIEKNRLHIVNISRLRERLEIDSHERGSEESRWWGLLRADSTSVIVQDNRSGAFQLLTVGDPIVVSRMCHEAWQGENSTILPLTSYDRSTILETSDSWKLADLDVEAFSYAPIPHTFELRCTENSDSTFYLMDNDLRNETLFPVQKGKGASGEWSMLQNQIFLGILGSLVIPRSETQGLLSTLQDAGVRFVYFSPRNMRRQKEIASQMGIDVAWNCAISLRTLDLGQEDPHRMVSSYADWDVNAKLPHGIESVRQHLRDVDNVPLLVSLFTDATKETTTEMIDIFQEYNDTVIAVGLSHLSRNSKIFSTADLAIGVDVLTGSLAKTNLDSLHSNTLLPAEVVFVSSISAHRCAFRLEGITSVEHMPTILAQGRASLAAATSASIFFLHGYLSFTLYVFFTVCSVASAIPFVPMVGSAIYLLIILPVVGIPMTMSDPEKRYMQKVPPKNDLSQSFGVKEGKVFCFVSLLKALPPAILPQLLYLIALGELMIETEPETIQAMCLSNPNPVEWVSVTRCSELGGYRGVAHDTAVALSLAELALLMVVASASFVYRTLSIWEEPPWRRNHLWVVSSLLALVIIAIYLLLSVERGTFSLLPWYYHFLAFIIMPFLCLMWDEYLKRPEKSVLDRAEKLRRLQFETRLGMWSPK